MLIWMIHSSFRKCNTILVFAAKKIASMSDDMAMQEDCRGTRIHGLSILDKLHLENQPGIRRDKPGNSPGTVGQVRRQDK